MLCDNNETENGEHNSKTKVAKNGEPQLLESLLLQKDIYFLSGDSKRNKKSRLKKKNHNFKTIEAENGRTTTPRIEKRPFNHVAR